MLSHFRFYQGLPRHSEFTIGSIVQVLYTGNKTWYQAEILENTDANRGIEGIYHIRYLIDDDEDENVTLDRIRKYIPEDEDYSTTKAPVRWGADLYSSSVDAVSEKVTSSFFPGVAGVPPLVINAPSFEIHHHDNYGSTYKIYVVAHKSEISPRPPKAGPIVVKTGSEPNSIVVESPHPYLKRMGKNGEDVTFFKEIRIANAVKYAIVFDDLSSTTAGVDEIK